MSTPTEINRRPTLTLPLKQQRLTIPMHHTRHIVIVSVSLAFLAFAFSARVQAAPEDRVQKLEEKVNSIEESQQQILQLLKDLNGGKPAPAPSQATPAPPPQQTPTPPKTPASSENLMPGAILDVWSVPLGADTRTIIASEMPLARILDKGPYFNLLAYTADSSLQSYKKKHLALRWSGLLHVSTAGRQLIVFESKIASRGETVSYLWEKSLFTLEIDGNQIAELKVNSGMRDKILNASTTLDLEAGYYPFRVTYYPGFSDRESPDMDCVLTIKSRAESDLTLTPLGAGTFFVKKPK